jgi:hypothetical protein
MHADDLADNIQNPHAGKLYNRPGGEDVYAGLPKVLLSRAKLPDLIETRC